jgi:hypothetical protein
MCDIVQRMSIEVFYNEIVDSVVLGDIDYETGKGKKPLGAIKANHDSSQGVST